jgi:hypothetical protein
MGRSKLTGYGTAYVVVVVVMLVGVAVVVDFFLTNLTAFIHYLCSTTTGRRNVLLRELQRLQRTSFIHFMALCLIPTSLLFIVLATVLADDEQCESLATTCEKEPRTFINAFTTRCICDAITVIGNSNPEP